MRVHCKACGREIAPADVAEMQAAFVEIGQLPTGTPTVWCGECMERMCRPDYELRPEDCATAEIPAPELLDEADWWKESS